MKINNLKLYKQIKQMKIQLIKPIELYCNGDITGKKLVKEIKLARNKLNMILKYINKNDAK